MGLGAWLKWPTKYKALSSSSNTANGKKKDLKNNALWLLILLFRKIKLSILTLKY
jgi:hypothetical protein